MPSRAGVEAGKKAFKAMAKRVRDAKPSAKDMKRFEKETGFTEEERRKIVESGMEKDGGFFGHMNLKTGPRPIDSPLNR